MKVIGISGKAEHGKTTVATMMYDTLTSDGHKVLLINYADLLKFICKQYFSWNGSKDKFGRWLLQYVGTDVVREKRPDYWTDFVKSILELFENEWEYAIIGDCRFKNEVECMNDFGEKWMHVRVVRPNYKSSLSESQLKHPSETDLDEVVPDGWISNDGTLFDLKNTVNNWIKENLYDETR